MYLSGYPPIDPQYLAQFNIFESQMLALSIQGATAAWSLFNKGGSRCKLQTLHGITQSMTCHQLALTADH